MKRRSSPPTDRVVEAIGLLATAPVERFTLTEIYERLGMTKATCHAVLAALVDHGWAVRDERTKTYGLGPALIALGQAAQRSAFSVDLARPCIQALSDAIHEDISIASIVDHEIVVLDRVGPTAAHSAVVGVRVPFVPPFGAGMVAWAPPDVLDAWLARSPVPLSPEREAALRATVHRMAQRPYGVARLSPGWLRVRRIVDTMPSGLPDNVRHLIAELVAELEPEHLLPGEYRRSDRLSIGTVHAPVFDHDGRVVLDVAANLFRDGVRGSDVDRIGAAVVGCADAITAVIDGRRPGARRP